MRKAALFDKRWFEAINDLDFKEYRDTLLAIAEVVFDCEAGYFCGYENPMLDELRARAKKIVGKCERGRK